MEYYTNTKISPFKKGINENKPLIFPQIKHQCKTCKDSQGLQNPALSSTEKISKLKMI